MGGEKLRVVVLPYRSPFPSGASIQSNQQILHITVLLHYTAPDISVYQRNC
jgi:hypothetical protein